MSASDLVSLSSEHSSVGNGELEREETVKVSLAAVITQILPNGNLVIAGKQEVRINYELRELTVSGVIRRRTSVPTTPCLPKRLPRRGFHTADAGDQ